MFGNMYVSAATGIPPAGNTPTSYVFNANNQITGASYDQAGNSTVINGNAAGYDFEGNQISIAGSGVNEAYGYDVDRRRVQKLVSGGSTTVYVYDALGRMAAEYSTAVDTPTCITCYLSRIS